ncbi:MAG TPA: AraC family transcriptional regulator ligand-binding domain-containing protein [Kofleriaceae bacterium]
MPATHGISVALLRPLAELLGQLDVEPADFLIALGVDDAMPPNTFVAATRVDQQLATIAERRGDPAFALTLARASLVRPLGLFGHLVWLSGTVRDALTRAVKFWSVVSQRTTLTLDETSHPIATLQQRVMSNAPRGRILTEYPFASLALRAREATRGAFAVRAVRFSHDGEATPAYHDVFRAPITFGAAVDELEIETAQLDLRLVGGDPITSAALEAKVVELIGDAPARDSFVDRVRSAAAANYAGAASLTEVASRMGISPRTLRRHLEKHGHTLRGIVDELRRERAHALLDAGSSVKEVAFQLGFSEPSAFSRAYKRWTGKAPKDDASR